LKRSLQEEQQQEEEEQEPDEFLVQKNQSVGQKKELELDRHNYFAYIISII